MPLFEPGNWPLTIWSGATYSIRATPSTNPSNLTGYNARAQFRENYTSTSPALTLGTAAGTAVISLGGTAGWVQLDIDASTTAALGSALGVYTSGQAAQLVWDLELVNGSDVTKFCYGVVTVMPEATR